MEVLDLFSAAAGGWSLGMHRAGFSTMAACEAVDWRRALYAENNPGVRIYDDVRTLTADQLVRDLGRLPAVVVGSPPCQDISPANTKGKGVEGARSSLYFEAIRIIGECRPRWFALENSANLRVRGADRVLGELEKLGYACWPFVVRAGDIGANHPRPRSWLIGCDLAQVADPDGDGRPAQWRRRRCGLDIPHAHDPDGRADHGDTAEDGCGPRWSRRRAGAAAGISVEACGDAWLTPDPDEERWQAGSLDGSIQPPPLSAAELTAGRRDARPRDAAHADQAGQADGCVVAGLRPPEVADNGCRNQRRNDVADADGEPDGTVHAEMGGRPGAGRDAAEPWADWNGGLASHLRLDDGISSWLAGTRVAVGGPKGTAAASLVVEAFGDAVVPQIPEAIGRAIWRVEAAMVALRGSGE